MFKVLFWGNFIPLQGTDYIVKAAKQLENEDVFFDMIGSGQTYKEAFNLARKLEIKNIKFFGKLSFLEIPNYIKYSDVCLGIFGNTNKTKRVIPNKVYEAIAMSKPVITADTPAIKELFTGKNDIILCKIADGKSLAEKILELNNDLELRKKIASGGYELFKRYCMPSKIGSELLRKLELIKKI